MFTVLYSDALGLMKIFELFSIPFYSSYGQKSPKNRKNKS